MNMTHAEVCAEAAARTFKGGSVLVTGETKTGKTTLLRRLQQMCLGHHPIEVFHRCDARPLLPVETGDTLLVLTDVHASRIDARWLANAAVSRCTVLMDSLQCGITADFVFQTVRGEPDTLILKHAPDGWVPGLRTGFGAAPTEPSGCPECPVDESDGPHGLCGTEP